MEVSEAEINDQIDAAYQTKYHRYGARIVNIIVTPQARAADHQTRASLNRFGFIGRKIVMAGIEDKTKQESS